MNDYEKIKAMQVAQDQAGTVKLLRQVDSLESEVTRLKALSEWQAGMIERAKAIILGEGYLDGGVEMQFISDLQSGLRKNE